MFLHIPINLVLNPFMAGVAAGLVIAVIGFRRIARARREEQ